MSLLTALHLMKTQPQYKKLVLVIFLVIQILLIQLLKNSPEFVERFYSNGLTS